MTPASSQWLRFTILSSPLRHLRRQLVVPARAASIVYLWCYWFFFVRASGAAVAWCLGRRCAPLLAIGGARPRGGPHSLLLVWYVCVKHLWKTTHAAHTWAVGR